MQLEGGPPRGDKYSAIRKLFHGATEPRSRPVQRNPRLHGKSKSTKIIIGGMFIANFEAAHGANIPSFRNVRNGWKADTSPSLHFDRVMSY